MPGWARFFEISRLRRSGTNVNDYRGSVGIVEAPAYGSDEAERDRRLALSKWTVCGKPAVWRLAKMGRLSHTKGPLPHTGRIASPLYPDEPGFWNLKASEV